MPMFAPPPPRDVLAAPALGALPEGVAGALGGGLAVALLLLFPVSERPWSFHSGKYSGGLSCFTDVGVCACPPDRWCAATSEFGSDMPLFACVAATSSGFTPWGMPLGVGVLKAAGVVVPPVAMGVERLEGSSEVKIVPEDGERMYFWEMVERRAWGKPLHGISIALSVRRRTD